MKNGTHRILLVSLLCWCAGASNSSAAYSLTDLGGGMYRVVFSCKPVPGTKSVALAGSFNGWKPDAMMMSGPDEEGRFALSLDLKAGRYEYKFVLDGSNWIPDPDNPHKTQGYQNAILFVGVDPMEAEKKVERGEYPIRLPELVDHPKEIIKLKELLGKESGDKPEKVVERWMKDHPMPVFSGDTVSFVFCDPKADHVVLTLYAYGKRMGIDIPRLVDGKPVYVATLERKALPDRVGYVYEVREGTRRRQLLDPNGWSVTSRNDRPASAMVEASSEKGRIELIPAVQTKDGFLAPRDVYVYLPPGYDQNAKERYPVLYMHDGQNCWDDPVSPFGNGGWTVNLVADRLIAEGKVRPFIVVGAANSPQRMEEYGAGPDITDIEQQLYLTFLRDELKPMIDKKYRTLAGPADTALMGSSMGGIISLQGALLSPQTWGQAACLSPAFRFTDRKGKTYANLVEATGYQPVRLYIDCGTAGRGQDGAPLTRRMVKLLRETGWKDEKDFMFFEDEGAVHNEKAWRARVEKPLVFLWGVENVSKQFKDQSN